MRNRRTIHGTGIIRSLGALATLVVLIAGVPLLLATTAGWPLPAEWPDWAQVWVDLRQLNIAPGLVIGGLAVGAWMLWAQAIWALAFELLNMVRAGRGMVARPAPLAIPLVTALVARLVAGVVSATLLTSSPASAGVIASAGTARQFVPAVSPGDSNRATETPTALTADRSIVVVADGETAWDVAERVFGDGGMVADLLEHNRISALDVRPGMELELPDGVWAVPREVTVVEGDHLWGLSTRRLEDAGVDSPSNAQIAAHVERVVDANQPMIADPDLIHPGQVVTMPELGEQPTQDIAVPTPSHPIPDISARPVDVEIDPDPDPGAEPEAEPVVDRTRVTTSDHVEVIDDDDPPLGLVAVSGIGLVTAAVGAIVARNAAQRIGRRRPGTTPRFAVPGRAERLISETSDDDALADLDRTLRRLGVSMRSAGLAVPRLVGVLIGPDTIRLLLAQPHHSAPEPYAVDRDGMIWSTSRPVPALDVEGALNPYPTLVAIGFTESDQLLIDIEYVGSLSLTGGFADVVDAMGTMALELATSPMADTIDVVCVGFGEELADLERITVVPSYESIRTRIDDHARGAAALALATDNTGPGGRADGTGDWTPMVVFDPLSELDAHSSALLAAVEATDGAGVSAVVSAVESAGLSIELDQHSMTVPAHNMHLHRRPLTHTERADLSTAVTAGRDGVDADTPDLLSSVGSSRGPSTVRSTAAPGAGDVEPGIAEYRVRVLGPLHVEDRNGHPVSFARSATPEFLAYLTHHRTGVEVGDVMTTLWPSTTARRTWIANVYADAVRSLAAGSGRGVVLTPRPGADDEYRLQPAVASDVEQFRALVSRSVHRPVDEAVELLIEALTMVEGVPYSNITSRWPIAEGHWQEATVMVDEAARCVAALALDHLDDAELADWATARGLLASPHSVELHRLRLRAAITLETEAATQAGGNGESVGHVSPDAVFQHYQAVVMADDHRPEATSSLDPELIELYESYRRSRPTAAVPSRDPETRERQLR